ncbi:MAG: PadR family transcriptional regulator [Nitrososphaerales archaeon]
MCNGDHKPCWHRYPERGWIQFLILRVLYETPMHGYQLMEEIEKRSSGLHKIEPGSIYTLLRRMERRGLLDSKWEQGEGGPEKRVYRVTKAGTEALREGLKMIVRRRALMDDLTEFYRTCFKSTSESESMASGVEK